MLKSLALEFSTLPLRKKREEIVFNSGMNRESTKVTSDVVRTKEETPPNQIKVKNEPGNREKGKCLQ